MWITDWDQIDPNESYIVCAINQDKDGRQWLGHPSFLRGWQVKRMMERCYAALRYPEFPGLDPQPIIVKKE